MRSRVLAFTVALLAFTSPSHAQLWKVKISRDVKPSLPADRVEPAASIYVPLLQNRAIRAVDGNTICFPTSTFIPNHFAFLGKSILSGADAKFFFADEISKMSAILAGKCIYEFSHRDLDFGPAEIAHVVDQHSPNVFFVFSRANDCSSFDKSQLDDPIFADAEFSCFVNFHGLFVK